MSSLKSLKATNLMVTKRDDVVVVCWNGRNEIHRFKICLNNKLEYTVAIFVNLFNRYKWKKYDSTFDDPRNKLTALLEECRNLHKHLIVSLV